MACKTYEKDINGSFYVTTQWSATKQLTMKFKLTKVFGKALFEIVSSLNKEGDEQEKEANQIKAFENAISKVFETSSPEELTALIKETLSSGETKREGKRITETSFDDIYNEAGLAEMYQACFFVIKSNYEDFFKGRKVGELLAKAKEKL